jgi:hypothetical protein
MSADDIVTRLRVENYPLLQFGNHQDWCTALGIMDEAADEIERVRQQRDRYAQRFLKLQSDYADLLKVANTYYMACLHPQDPCKVCQAFEEHVHD